MSIESWRLMLEKHNKEQLFSSKAMLYYRLGFCYYRRR